MAGHTQEKELLITRVRMRQLPTRRSVWGFGLVAVALLSLLASSPASATTVQPGTAIPIAGGPNDIACTSATSCIAVGTFNQIDMIADGTVTPLTTETDDDWVAVACATSTMCVAVGTSALDNQVFTIINNGVVGPEVTAAGMDFLTGVACPTSTECLLTGDSSPSAKTAAGLVGELDLTSQSVDHVASLAKTRFNGIACATASSCLVVGVRTTDTNLKFDAPFNPSTSKFGSPKTILETPYTVECNTQGACLIGATTGNYGAIISVKNAVTGAPSATSLVTNMKRVSGIACAVPGVCVAVGTGTGSTRTDLVALPTRPSGALHAQSIAGTLIFNAIACGATSSCDAVALGTAGPSLVVPLTVAAS